jgi:hypothetical protein
LKYFLFFALYICFYYDVFYLVDVTWAALLAETFCAREF